MAKAVQREASAGAGASDRVRPNLIDRAGESTDAILRTQVPAMVLSAGRPDLTLRRIHCKGATPAMIFK